MRLSAIWLRPESNRLSYRQSEAFINHRLQLVRSLERSQEYREFLSWFNSFTGTKKFTNLICMYMARARIERVFLHSIIQVAAWSAGVDHPPPSLPPPTFNLDFILPKIVIALKSIERTTGSRDEQDNNPPKNKGTLTWLVPDSNRRFPQTVDDGPKEADALPLCHRAVTEKCCRSGYFLNLCGVMLPTDLLGEPNNEQNKALVNRWSIEERGNAREIPMEHKNEWMQLQASSDMLKAKAEADAETDKPETRQGLLKITSQTQLLKTPSPEVLLQAPQHLCNSRSQNIKSFSPLRAPCRRRVIYRAFTDRETLVYLHYSDSGYQRDLDICAVKLYSGVGDCHSASARSPNRCSLDPWLVRSSQCPVARNGLSQDELCLTSLSQDTQRQYVLGQDFVPSLAKDSRLGGK
ncbi:hypothetical protein B0H13DRAFT_1891027 [Mycena leptocephala]|nr:hypothetical protein B0H13DRAFT_1891027 [Mycena leptocephala]